MKYTFKSTKKKSNRPNLKLTKELEISLLKKYIEEELKKKSDFFLEEAKDDLTQKVIQIKKDKLYTGLVKLKIQDRIRMMLSIFVSTTSNKVVLSKTLLQNSKLLNKLAFQRQKMENDLKEAISELIDLKGFIPVLNLNEGEKSEVFLMEIEDNLETTLRKQEKQNKVVNWELMFEEDRYMKRYMNFLVLLDECDGDIELLKKKNNLQRQKEIKFKVVEKEKMKRELKRMKIEDELSEDLRKHMIFEKQQLELLLETVDENSDLSKLTPAQRRVLEKLLTTDRILALERRIEYLKVSLALISKQNVSNNCERKLEICAEKSASLLESINEIVRLKNPIALKIKQLRDKLTVLYHEIQQLERKLKLNRVDLKDNLKDRKYLNERSLVILNEKLNLKFSCFQGLDQSRDAQDIVPYSRRMMLLKLVEDIVYGVIDISMNRKVSRLRNLLSKKREYLASQESLKLSRRRKHFRREFEIRKSSQLSTYIFTNTYKNMLKVWFFRFRRIIHESKILSKSISIKLDLLEKENWLSQS